MGTILTMKGIDELVKKKKKGEPLPDGWRTDLVKTISMKERLILKWLDEYQEAIDQLKEIKQKAEFLYESD